MNRCTRVVFVAADDPSCTITLDLVLDDQDKPLPNLPFHGWFGRPAAPIAAPIIVRPDGEVIFRDSEFRDQATGITILELHKHRVIAGQAIEYRECDVVTIFKIRDLLRMIE